MPEINLPALSDALPRHAEEGPYREVVAESSLLDAMRGDLSEKCATPAIHVLRRIFESLCLLDTRELALDHWAFVSFPAYLMARSLLESFATPGQTLFESGYWQQGGHQPSVLIEEQRRLLSAIEERRVRFHPTGHAQPIRFVHVAWGMIRLGRDFLLKHREDRNRPEAKNYVFPGGRFNLNDLPQPQRNAESLRIWSNDNAKAVVKALDKTLQRELSEELLLRAGLDYQPNLIQTLQPYRKIEGAQNNHAFTEYQISIYGIQLTPEGEARLLERVARDDDLIWFDLEDIARPQGRSDGKSAFVDALRAQMRDSLPDFLLSVPESSGTPYLLTSESSAVDLPVSSHQPFRAGKTGKEKDLAIPLDADELALLWTLAALARGLAVQANAEHIQPLGGGWVKLQSAQVIDTARSLAGKLAFANLPLIQIVSEAFVRINIDPTLVYFSESAFRYNLDDYNLNLVLQAQTQPWAEIKDASKTVVLDATAKLAIQFIYKNGRLWKGETMLEGKDFDRELRDKIDRHLRPLGLRKLVRMDRDDYLISVPCQDADTLR